jgi:hypothetical protein
VLNGVFPCYHGRRLHSAVMVNLCYSPIKGVYLNDTISDVCYIVFLHVKMQCVLC